ncbi:MULTISPECIES: hypothetical protein [unclassified Paraburkholderia]|uniref:hypothetical protein n=1 Tax=unclassified Paraburkholderia TaxID=2615204 RepID=UPI002AB2BB07|nr:MULTISPECIES: hypothetical protein [unclassified Paraburkholderia]
MTDTPETASSSPTPLSIRMAGMLFPLLVDHAKKQQLVTYGDLTKQAKAQHRDHPEVQNMIPVSMGHKLDVVRTYCLKNQLPDLASIAVNQDTRAPGESYVAKADAIRLQQEVFAFDWKSRAVEFNEHLAQEKKRTRKLIERSERDALAIMRKYYEANKAQLPANIVTYREAIVTLLEKGHDAEDAFEMALEG